MSKISSVHRESGARLKESFHLSEILFALAGVFILASGFVIYQWQDFTLWGVAKLFYVAALILVLKYT